MKIKHTIINGTDTHHAYVIIKLGRKVYQLIDTTPNDTHIVYFERDPRLYINAIATHLAPSPYTKINFYLLHSCMSNNKVYGIN